MLGAQSIWEVSEVSLTWAVLQTFQSGQAHAYR